MLAIHLSAPYIHELEPDIVHFRNFVINSLTPLPGIELKTESVIQKINDSTLISVVLALILYASTLISLTK